MEMKIRVLELDSVSASGRKRHNELTEILGKKSHTLHNTVFFHAMNSVFAARAQSDEQH